VAEARSDAELLARAGNEPDLFGVLFDRHFATIHRYLERRVGVEGADELAGEVSRIAFEQRRRFRGGDDRGLRQAVGALGTSHDWRVLRDVQAAGEYPRVLWECADAAATNASIAAGKMVTVEQTYHDALGRPAG
jgi:hypothetical protein